MKFVEDYESAKYYDTLPAFSYEFYDYLYSDTIGINSDSIIADVGCGTGRLTLDFLCRGNKVYGIDPDKNMRDICFDKCHEFRYNLKLIDGTEKNMNIPNNSVDYIIVSQAFHRFEPKEFKKECDRVLKEKNNVLIIWYRVDFYKPIFKELLQIVKKNYTNYHTRYLTDEIEGAKLEEKENNDIAQCFFENNSIMKEVISTAHLNKEQFKNLALSLALFPITHEMNTVSKVLSDKEFDMDGYKNGINTIFEKYSKKDVIDLKFRVQIHSKKR